MKILRVEMPDGSKFDVPVSVIAEDRAEYYKIEFDNDVEKSLIEDTGPLFDSDDYAIKDWAANNMNWKDVAKHAVMVEREKDVDYQEGWCNGGKSSYRKRSAGG